MNGDKELFINGERFEKPNAITQTYRHDSCIILYSDFQTSFGSLWHLTLVGLIKEIDDSSHEGYMLGAWIECCYIDLFIVTVWYP